MIKKQKNKKGFTMAELLIVIGVIGVLAALTIPMLYNHSNNKQLVSQTIKMANILSNAFKEADVVEGLTKKSTTQDFKTAFEKHLKILPTCEEPYNVCLVDGGRYQYQTLAGAQLEDGAIEYGNTYSDGKATGLKDSFARLLVDVNGKKGPNKAGKDLYVFYVTKYGIFADGLTTECSGLDCGAYVLAHHKIWTGEVEEVANGGGGEDPVSPGGVDDPIRPFILYTNALSCPAGYRRKTSNNNCVDESYIKDGKIDNCNAYKMYETYNEDKGYNEEHVDYLSCSSCKDGYENNDGVCTPASIIGCVSYGYDEFYYGSTIANCNVCDDGNGYVSSGSGCVKESKLSGENGLYECYSYDQASCEDALGGSLTRFGYYNYMTSVKTAPLITRAGGGKILYDYYTAAERDCAARGLGLVTDSGRIDSRLSDGNFITERYSEWGEQYYHYVNSTCPSSNPCSVKMEEAQTVGNFKYICGN